VMSSQKPKVMTTHPGQLNKYGYFICGSCAIGQHLGIRHFGLCSCSCDGHHTSKGELIEVQR
jgi:hypothetical protein